MRAAALPEERVLPPFSTTSALSLVVPGAGQLANRDLPKAWIHLGIGAVLAGPLAAAAIPGLAGSATRASVGTELLGHALIVSNLAFHIYSALDAHQVERGLLPPGRSPL